MNRLLTHLNNPKKIIDIGANIGEFSKFVFDVFPDCEFWLVEANKNCEENLKSLPFFYEIVALGKENDELDFFIERKNLLSTGASLKKENTVFYDEGKYFKEKVKVETLDSKNYFESETIDLLKLDVQGSELDILLGGNATLKRSRLVLLEVSNVKYNSNAPLSDEICNFMFEKGFRIIDMIETLRFNTPFGPIVGQMDLLFENMNIYK